MKKSLCILFIAIFIFTLLPQNISYSISASDKYLDIKLSRPIVNSRQINLESSNGFALLEANNRENLLLVMEDRNIKVIFDSNGYINLHDAHDNIIFTFSKDDNVLLSSMDIRDSIIKVEKDGYRDYLKFINKNNEIMVINHVNLENYLYGVVPKEMGYNFPLEALKAQAVASRSFALSNTKHKADGYDLCDSTDCQVYSGYHGEHQNTNQAVDETKGILALYGGEAIQAMYHSTSSGMTEDSQYAWGGNLPYLKPVIDEFSTDAPYSNWNYTISLSELSNKLQMAGINIGSLKNIEITETTNTGNVTKVKLIGTTGEEIVTGSRFRSLVGNVDLKSTWFNINGNGQIGSEIVYVLGEGILTPKVIDLNEAYVLYGKGLQRPTRSSTRRVIGKDRQENLNSSTPISSSQLTIEGKGYGHGVGMSQYGAKKMAELGYSYDEILRFYYTGIDVY